MQSSNQRSGKLDPLPQHAIIKTRYLSMQPPNHRPGKLDTLSQFEVETNHRLENSDMLSQHAHHRQAILACTAKYAPYKKPKTADKLTQ